MAVPRLTLEKDVAEILKGADLSTLSAKKVRKQLEARHSVDLTDRKKEVDDIVMSFVNGESEPDRDRESNGTQNNGVEAVAEKSDSSGSEFEPCDDTTPVRSKQYKKRIESKTSNDEDLARQLQDEEGTVRRTRAGPRKQHTAKRKKEPKPKDASAKKRKTSYNKHCVLSPALAQVMGKNRMPRCDVVKNMWVIIKERNLQDPKNKSFMLCDEELQAIFKRKRVKTFGMMKFLSDHIHDPDEYETMYGTVPDIDDEDAASNDEIRDSVHDSDSD